MSAMLHQVVSITRTGSKGRGIVATRAIAAGTVIEVAPCVELSSADCDRVAETILDHYYFAHPASDELGLVVFGLASLVNHSERPNTVTEWHHEPEQGWLAVLRALCDIAPGDELTRRYACPIWFDDAQESGAAATQG